MSIKVSIVVSMYNRKKEVIEVIDKLFFPSLLNNASKEIELVVVDDASPLSKETDDLIEKYRKRLDKSLGRFRFVRNRKNLGFAGSYNRGIAMAKGELILVANDDIYFTKNSIKALCSTALSDKSMGAVGPVTNYCASFQNTHLFKKLESYSASEIGRIEEFASWLKKVMNGEQYDSEILIGFCIVYRRSILRKLGAFDLRYEYGNFEDQHLNRKIQNAGYKLVLDADVFVEHGGIEGGSGSIYQHPLRALRFFFINAIKFSLGQKNFIRTMWIYIILSFIQFQHWGFTISHRIRKAAKEKNLSRY